MASRQTKDAKTGKAEINTVLSYKEFGVGKPPRHRSASAKRKAKNTFVPRADYLNAPTAEQLRALNSTKKPQPLVPLGTATAGATRNPAASAAPVFHHPDEQPAQTTKPPAAGGAGVTVVSLGCVHGTELAEDRRRGAADDERRRRTQEKLAEIAAFRREQDALKGQEVEYDVLTGIPRKALPTAAARAAEAAARAAAAPPEQKLDIFGRPLPQRPPPPQQQQSSAPRAGPPDLTPRQLLQQAQLQPPQLLQAANDAGSHIFGYKAPVHRDPLAEAAARAREPPTDILGRPLHPALLQRQQDMAAGRPLVAPTLAPAPATNILGQPEPGLVPRALRRSDVPSYILEPPPMEARVRTSTTFDASAQENATVPAVVKAPNFTEVYADFYASNVYRALVVGFGGWGVRKLRFALLEQDKDGDGQLTKSELRNATGRAGATFDDGELDRLMAAAPSAEKKNGLPLLLIPTLLDILRRGPLGAKRTRVLKECFQKALQVSQNGRSSWISFADLEAATNFTGHASFQPFERSSARTVATNWVSAWGPEMQRASRVTFDVFAAYYHDMAASFPKENEFCKMLREMHGVL